MTVQVFGQRKPPRGLLPNKTHPLMRGLVVGIVANEGVGQAVYDYVRNIQYLGHSTDDFEWVASANGIDIGFLSPGTSKASIEVGDVSGLFDTEATLAIRLKVRDTAPSDYKKVGLHWGLTTHGGINYYPWTNGNIYSNTFKSTSSVFTPSSIPDDYHWVIITTKPGTNNWKFYINETLERTDTGDSTVQTGTDCGFALSVKNSASYCLDGYISDIRMWNRELSLEEINKLIARPYEMFERWAPVWAFAPVSAVGKPVYFGSAQVDKLYLGSTELERAYLGAVEVFNRG